MSSSGTYRPKFGYDIRIKPDMPPHDKKVRVRCAMPGCEEAAHARAPRHRRDEDGHWLCREHLRERNARWNFFAGMSNDEIERFRIEALTGHRPTWPLGRRLGETARHGGSSAHTHESDESTVWGYTLADVFGIFETAPEPLKPKRRLTKLQMDALAVLNLEDTATLLEIKTRYKELVKRFHPDANGGNRGTEERLKLVIKAYGCLRATGLV